MSNKIKYSANEIVVGGNIEAALYSYLNNLPLVLISFSPPFYHEKTCEELKIFGLEYQHEVFNRLLFLNSLAGNVIDAESIEYPMEGEEKILIISLNNGITVNLEYEKLTSFEYKITEERKLEVLDIFDIRRLMKPEIYNNNFVSSELEKPIEETVFFPSVYARGDKKKITLCLVFTAPEGKLDEFEYTQTYIKILIKRMFKKKFNFQLARTINLNLGQAVKHIKREIRIKYTGEIKIKDILEQYKLKPRTSFLSFLHEIFTNLDSVKGIRGR